MSGYLPEKLIAIVNDLYGTDYTVKNFISYSISPITTKKIRREYVYYIPHLQFYILIKKND